MLIFQALIYHIFIFIPSLEPPNSTSTHKSSTNLLKPSSSGSNSLIVVTYQSTITLTQQQAQISTSPTHILVSQTSSSAQGKGLDPNFLSSLLAKPILPYYLIPEIPTLVTERPCPYLSGPNIRSKPHLIPPIQISDSIDIDYEINPLDLNILKLTISENLCYLPPHALFNFIAMEEKAMVVTENGNLLILERQFIRIKRKARHARNYPFP